MLPDICKDIEPNFLLCDSALEHIVTHFRRELQAGLEQRGEDVAMIPSFVPGVPDGSEQGTFLALDLGGTNLRVCEVRLLGNHKFEMKQQKYKVSDELKEGEATVLFDYIADSVDAFLTEIGSDVAPEKGEPLLLGFTFSFPVEQTAIDSGTLLTWTKGFNAKNAIGNDVVKLLNDAFERKHIHVRCSALVNDTVGTLLSRSYQHGPALIGAIFGTGTNGAYIDKTSTIKKLGEKHICELEECGEHAGEYMVINTEWGAFDNKRQCLPVSIFDAKLDRMSINPRKQAFEKMVSGMYLGEITRNILLHLIDSNVLFGGYSTDVLNEHYGFDTSFVSAVEGAKTDEDVITAITDILKVKRKYVEPRDVELVRWATKLVAHRAAFLAATAIAAVVQLTEKHRRAEDKETIDVGVDGSVAQYLPGFETNVRVALRKLLGEAGEKRITIGLAKDGSGVGAALTALQAKKAIERSKKAAAK
ncbi:hypothetical protein CcaverHIS631_0402350 [Cutaneotrichosporon cavernicola]|nr:hypothetical protein CcaverHIS631_0402350 [Cutaneotrichosporon cavernicola]BEJ06969.1 hypothetical protein CcaverHIS641_0402380 [Cutaneotrichosporon cavernicola]